MGELFAITAYLPTLTGLRCLSYLAPYSTNLIAKMGMT